MRSKADCTELLDAKRQLAAQKPALSLDEGYMAIVVNEAAFNALTTALQYAEDKDYMPDAMREEWSAFFWEVLDVNSPAPQAKESATDRFFCRIDSFDLTPGWKSAGFCLSVSTDALRRLRTVEVSSEERQALVDRSWRSSPTPPVRSCSRRIR